MIYIKGRNKNIKGGGVKRNIGAEGLNCHFDNSFHENTTGLIRHSKQARKITKLEPLFTK